MRETKKAELIAKHAAARRRLRAEGREESLGNVLGIAGGSKRDIVALWAESDPDVAPLPMSDAEANFKQTFADYLAAATRFNAVSVGRYGLPARHPWYVELEQALATARQQHIAAWHTLEGYEEAARPQPEPTPEPEPEPITLENMRAFYKTGGLCPWLPHAPWPTGGVPPLESYAILQALARECEAMLGKAGRERMDEFNRLGQLPSGSDAAFMHGAETRMNAALVLQQRIKSDMQMLEMKAQSQGVTL